LILASTLHSDLRFVRRLSSGRSGKKDRRSHRVTLLEGICQQSDNLAGTVSALDRFLHLSDAVVKIRGRVVHSTRCPWKLVLANN
jgi:hypothetical protein